MTREIRLERTYDASLEDVWEMWTTKDGIESWWGPDGFRVDVIEMDVRPGGQLLYAMTAIAEAQIGFLRQAGMPLSTKTRITYTDVVPRVRLAYVNHVDFVPGVATYETPMRVEMSQAPSGVHLVLTLHPMHEEVWTGRMVAGWENELGKLERALTVRKG
jgi:uncharacterized protein YndB with AHSA1/START domain